MSVGALALLHPVERCLQARERAADSARALGEDAGARIDRRAAIERHEEGALVVEQRRLERKRAPRLLDRAGGLADRAGARFQSGLTTQNLFELLLVLLLVDQLAAGDAVDAAAQLGDAVLVAELHLGLPGDEAREHVLAEGKVGGGRDAPHRHDHQRADHDPERDGTEPQLPPGMGQGCSPPTTAAWVRRRAGLGRHGWNDGYGSAVQMTVEAFTLPLRSP